MPHAPSGTQWTITYGSQSATVVEVGGGLREYRDGDREIVDGYAEDEICPNGAGQILAPWPNRLRDGKYTFGGHTCQAALSEPATHNAIHGLVRWQPATLVDRSESAVTVSVVLPAQPAYPWTLSLTTRHELDDAGLTVTHTATNLGGEPAPFGLGAHPYLFPPGGSAVDDVWVGIPARSRLLTDTRGLPIGAAKVTGSEWDFGTPKRLGQSVLDTAFGDVVRDDSGRSAVTLAVLDGPATTIWADASFGWWQVYTADTTPPPRRRRSIAVEPMTCPPDALRSGRDLVTLKPGEPWTASWGISPR
ncbi:aldose 1-epimerase family protein [Hamadaea tsunoensis]|uniref:aldose 1-epimerase family protein n=1 Tax=Hamadaea tsunoensis TaxID=53368 RepID=UPI00041522C1|nr:aldose 1-epimerase family protein [Hamadaea tsunoensis]